MSAASPPASPKPFTGRAFLMWMTGSFAVVFAVNFIMAYYAITTFNGVDSKSSYAAGLTYDTELTAAADQAARGWTVDARVARAAPGEAIVTASFKDRAGQPVPGLSVTARLEHPANEYLDQSGPLAETAPGQFAGAIRHVKDGGWTLEITGSHEGRVLFKSRNRLVLGPKI